MSVTERLKKIIKDPDIADDGSVELAKSWLENIEDSRHLESLMANPAFKNILKGMKAEFKEKLLQTIAQDPELNAMRQVFIRLVGLDEAENRIEEYIDGIMESNS